MWNPIKIEIYNLFAHKESIYYFKNNACTVIFGKNDTDRGLENNGAGKTTLFEAICIALTNESLRSIKKDSFINRDEEECTIIFHLYNPVLKMKLKIVRKFFRSNKPVKIEIWENDNLNKQVVSVNEANKRVIELIGITREDLLRYFIISQDSRYTFFSASDVEKKEIMNRITSADMINPVIEENTRQLREKEAEYNVLSDEVRRISDKIEILSEQREELLLKDNSEEIEELSNKIEETEMKISEISDALNKCSKSIEVREEQKKAITYEDVSALKKEVKILKKEVEELSDELTETKQIRRKISSELEETITCPKCKHEFINESEFDLTVNEARQMIKEADLSMSEIDKKIGIKRKRIQQKTAKISESERALELIEGIDEEISSIKRKIKNRKQDQLELLDRKNKLSKEFEEIKTRNRNDVLIKNIEERISSFESESKNLSKKIIKIKEEIDIIRFWQYNMGKSGFLTYLANKSIKIIEGITNSFLKKFGTDISVLMNGFTVLKSGEVREKIDVFVMNDGMTAEVFLSKSGGERGRVALAGALGIQHLINMSTNGRGLNLLCFDECFHGFDSYGQESIIKIFENMGITILVITQNVGEGFNNENKLYVVKENDVSRYI